MPNGHTLNTIGVRGTVTGGGMLDPAAPRPAPQRPDPCADDCTPRCPACGGLKCLCRPRFFCGQLLTDEDLTALEQYVIDKNRLHNRYLVGWGVACGLEVSCDPCDPRSVVVRSGYAVSPCGDDIVVCADTSVDICALIDTCNQQTPQCEGPYQRPPADCRGGQDHWILAICYDERPVRGVTAQIGAGDTPASARCSCGGAGGGGCGCKGGAKTSSGGGCGCGSGASKGTATQTSCGCGGGAASATPKKKPANPQCEPTRICEGYRFVAYPRPPQVALLPPDNIRGVDQILVWLYTNRARFGPMLERILCCALRAVQLRASIREGQKLDETFARETYVDYATALEEFAADFALHRCAFVTRASQLRTQAQAWTTGMANRRFNAAVVNELAQRTEDLDNLWLEIIAECVCSGLLPACPPPAPDNCVPLGVITLKTGDCRVVEICNWEQRKILVTWPTIMYWLSWLPLDNLSKWVHSMCCGSERGESAFYFLALAFGLIRTSLEKDAAAAAQPKKKKAARMTPLMRRAMSSDQLVSSLGDVFERLATGQGRDDPGWAGLAARVAAFSPAAAAAAPPQADVADLTRRLDDAEQRLRDQDQQIRTLNERIR